MVRAGLRALTTFLTFRWLCGCGRSGFHLFSDAEIEQLFRTNAGGIEDRYGASGYVHRCPAHTNCHWVTLDGASEATLAALMSC